MIRLATHGDALQIAENMANDDEREVRSLGYTPQQSVSTCVYNSSQCWVWGVDEQPLAMFGIVKPTCMTHANPWFLTTNSLALHGLSFYKDFRRVINYMLGKYGTLESWVDSRHTKSLKLLGKFGFTVVDSQPFGPEGVVFNQVRLG